MGPFVRTIGVLLPALALAVFGCAKQPTAAEPGMPSQPPAASSGDTRTVVAKVNGVELWSDGLSEIMSRLQQAGQQTARPESKEALRKKALDHLVLEELAAQEARRQNLSLGEKGLDNAMAKLQAQLGHEEGYKNYLAKENITDAELRSRVERSLLIQLIVDKEVVKKTVVSEGDVRAEYEKHKDRYRAPERIAVVDVVLFLDQNDAASLAKAREILARINADRDKDPANLTADGSFIVRPLDSAKTNEPALFDAARKLQPGELSDVISTPDGLHIVKLTAYTPERQLSYDEAKGVVEWRLRSSAQQKRRLEWERELRTNAKIELFGEPSLQGQGQ